MRKKKIRGSKVFVLGIDGASWNVLDGLMAKGVMPNLSLIVKRHGKGRLKSTIPPQTLPAWMDFATGVNSGKHGAYSLIKLPKEFNKQEAFDGKEVKVKRFYEWLDEKGKRCVIINLPGAFPLKLKHGVGLASFTDSPSESYGYPDDLGEKVKELKDYKVFPGWHLGSNQKRVVEAVMEVEQKRFEVGKRLFQGDWDFFFYLISGSDWLMHKLGGEFLAGKKKTARLMERFFKQVDEMLGWFVENNPGANVLIMSDHGFKGCGGKFFINSWLGRQGWLKKQSRMVGESSSRSRLERAIERKLGGYSIIAKYVSGIFLVVGWLNLRGGIPWLRGLGVEELGVRVDEKKTRVYGQGFFMRLGQFKSKQEKEEFTRQLVVRLKKLRFKGKRVLKGVYRREEVYKGGLVKQIPDLVLEWGEMMVDVSLADSRLFEESAEAHHSSEGILIGWGPDIKGQVRTTVELKDLGPTILRLLRVKQLKGMEGKVLPLVKVKA